MWLLFNSTVYQLSACHGIFSVEEFINAKSQFHTISDCTEIHINICCIKALICKTHMFVG